MRHPSAHRSTKWLAFSIPLAAAFVLACSRSDGNHAQAAVSHDTTQTPSASKTQDDTTLPPDADHALARLNASPRHGEYVMIPREGRSPMRAWIEFPQRSTKAPVIIVVHEIFGLSTWVRSVADQLAQAGFIAIAPDLLTDQKLPKSPDSLSMQDGIAAVSKLQPSELMQDIDAVAKYAGTIPAATNKIGILGFCWGGGTAFAYAAHAPNLNAAVVYYGPSIKPEQVATVHASVLGLYGAEDARVTKSVPPVAKAFEAQKKTFETHVFQGAGHAFARDQKGQNGANLRALQQAWPATIAWFRRYLET